MVVIIYKCQDKLYCFGQSTWTLSEKSNSLFSRLFWVLSHPLFHFYSSVPFSSYNIHNDPNSLSDQHIYPITSTVFIQTLNILKKIHQICLMISRLFNFTLCFSNRVPCYQNNKDFLIITFCWRYIIIHITLLKTFRNTCLLIHSLTSLWI
jgi:hypothetical protein